MWVELLERWKENMQLLTMDDGTTIDYSKKVKNVSFPYIRHIAV